LWEQPFYKGCLRQIKEDTKDFTGGNSEILKMTLQTGYPTDPITYRYRASCNYDFAYYDTYPFKGAVIFFRWSLLGY
jgi:hypothetical protein